MKRIILLALLLITFVSQALATAQVPDILVYQGKEYKLLTNPLEPFFEEHPDLRPESRSTALWRGYIAKFEIQDNQLVVADIYVPDYYQGGGNISLYDKIFPGQKNVPVTWMTGILTLPCGDMTNYVHMGYGSTYSGYKLLQIENGKLIAEQDFTEEEYAQYRDLQYEAFKTTKAYSDALEEIKKSEFYDANMEEMLDDFIRSFYSSQYGSMLIPFPEKKKGE